ncbi:DNA polymerase III, epsilon subunit [marine gamma proteobacterium HTCC2080]|nr:DNA polymerase III, epsilon subunit [marine gamma proteobacterium HTCC2080]MDG1493066.1 deoxynucleoside kinase [Luminiphilus sp.]MDG1828809.1 deoxynucleoside kinase [Luminiphilus sp.]MDG2138082.1 deoxynucleoside kinase [Luminiphilus sp.]MDG2494425.1 deoxynucleoside kinase [Luminiphilus sp.]
MNANSPEIFAPTNLDLRGRTPPGYIAVEGPIGVGKTTLARRLAEAFNYQVLLEDAHENPFLDRFYQNRKEAALATQLFFLFQRSQKIADLRQTDIFEPVRVSDFLIDKDPLFARINLDPDEYSLYEKVFQQLTIDAPLPDLVIYLQASPDRLLERILSRGVSSERGIDREYLEQINEVYSEFFLYYDAAPLLIVNANEIDLSQGDEDFSQLVNYLLDIRSGRHYFNPTFFG